MGRKNRAFPYTPCLAHGYVPPLFTRHTRGVYLLQINEPTFSHYFHSKSVAYFSVHSSIVHSMGLDKCITACIYHCSIMQNNFTALKHSVLHLFILPKLPTFPGNHWFFPVSIVLSFPGCCVVRIVQSFQIGFFPLVIFT